MRRGIAVRAEPRLDHHRRSWGDCPNDAWRLGGFCSERRTGILGLGMESLLFVYGSLLPGEPDHDALSGARCLGVATAPSARLVDLGAYPALIEVTTPGAPKEWVVAGELYAVDEVILSRIDVVKQHPALFQRRLIAIADGRKAFTYVMADEQLRGRKRLPSGDWKRRFESRRRAAYTEPPRYHRR